MEVILMPLNYYKTRRRRDYEVSVKLRVSYN